MCTRFLTERVYIHLPSPSESKGSLNRMAELCCDISQKEFFIVQIWVRAQLGQGPAEKVMDQIYISPFYVAITKYHSLCNLQSKKVYFSHSSGGWRTRIAEC